jgi:hypothetical protein
MRRVTVTFAVGLALVVAVGAVALTRAPPRVVGVGAPVGEWIGPDGAIVGSTSGDPTVCQANEVLPGGVSAVRLGIWAFFGSRVRVMLYHGAQLLTEGRRGADWTSDSVTVPVRPVAHTISDVRLCFVLGPNSEPLTLDGAVTPPREAAVISEKSTRAAQLPASDSRPLGGRVTVEYLAAGRGSWWSRALSVARRMGLGRFYSGTWIALLIAALMLAVGVLAVRLTWRELP